MSRIKTLFSICLCSNCNNLNTLNPIPSSKVVCCIFTNITILTNLSIETNSVGPDQTAPTRAVLSGSTLFVKKVSEIFQQTTKTDDFYCDWRFMVEQ